MSDGQKRQTAVDRAKARIAKRDAQWKAMHADHEATPNFTGYSDEDLIAVAESGRLRPHELAELDAVWFERFGEWLSEPASASTQAAVPASEPAPTLNATDLMTRADVARKLRASVSSVQRMERDGRLPKPAPFGARGRRHLARDVERFVESLDEQRQAKPNRQR